MADSSSDEDQEEYLKYTEKFKQSVNENQQLLEDRHLMKSQLEEVRKQLDQMTCDRDRLQVDNDRLRVEVKSKESDVVQQLKEEIESLRKDRRELKKLEVRYIMLQKLFKCHLNDEDLDPADYILHFQSSDEKVEVKAGPSRVPPVEPVLEAAVASPAETELQAKVTIPPVAPVDDDSLSMGPTLLALAAGANSETDFSGPSDSPESESELNGVESPAASASAEDIESQCFICKGSLPEDKSRDLESILCSICQTWEHNYCVEEGLFFNVTKFERGDKRRDFGRHNDTKNKECFHCNKLLQCKDPKKRSVVQNTEYIINNMNLKSERKASAVNAGHDCDDEDTDEEKPDGVPGTWTYYWNLFLKERNLNVKIGDCVYMSRKHRPGDDPSDADTGLDVFRVQYLFRDAGGQAWVCGHHYDTPLEIYRSEKQKFFKNERFHVIDLNGRSPLTSVVGHCCCVSKRDYHIGKPRGVKLRDVFIIEASYCQRTKTQTMINLSKSDYKLCKEPYGFRKFPVPLEPFYKTYEPGKEIGERKAKRKKREASHERCSPTKAQRKDS